VPQDLWDRVKARQQMLKRNTRPDRAGNPFWERQRPRFLITGLAKCGTCGSSYVKISKKPVRLRRRPQPRHLREPSQHPP